MSIRLVHHDRPVRDRVALRLALAGQIPADALTTEDRQRLVTAFHKHGWTDVEVASYTRMSTYTTARIRERLGLAANKIEGAVA